MKTIVNRRAKFDYELLETYEAGLSLTGGEVKSIKAGQMSLAGSFVKFNQGEAWLGNAYINPYPPEVDPNYDPRRARKLLLHQKELFVLQQQFKEKKLTIVPVECYNKAGKIKLKIALARGKKQYEKKEAMKKREASRNIQMF